MQIAPGLHKNQTRHLVVLHTLLMLVGAVSGCGSDVARAASATATSAPATLASALPRSISPSASTPATSFASYALTIDTPTNGTIAGASGTPYTAGSSVTLTASTSGTYGKKTWTGGAQSCETCTTCRISKSADKIVGVQFMTAPVGFGAGLFDSSERNLAKSRIAGTGPNRHAEFLPTITSALTP